MSFLRRLEFDLWYLRRPPWDSGIIPPEVVEIIITHQPGRALDLGCGTGTSSLALAHAGWTVTGVDFIPRAIKIAKQKANKAGLVVDFRVANVVRLPPFPSPFSLLLDIGCFHGLSTADKSAYLNQLNLLLAPEGTWMMYGFFKPDESPGPGLIPADLESIQLKLIKRQNGVDRKGRPSAWFWFRNKQ
jgi:ubiquinone/menaquinone biosynthesis C-methylase UbiE